MGESQGKRKKTQMGGSVWQQCSRHDRFACGGVCPFCLHERLSSLCPDCAHDLPCSCTPRASFSDVPFAGVGSVGRVANLIECEPAFRRPKSLLWSAKPEPMSEDFKQQEGLGSTLRRLLRGIRGETKTKPTVMTKSRSLAGELLVSPVTVMGKGNGWYFPSPIKVFRHSRISKMMFQQTSPLYRG